MSLDWSALFTYRRFLLWAFFTSFGNVQMGYAYTVFGQLLAFPSFLEQFGYLYNGEYVIPAAHITAFSAAQTIGSCTGSVIAGFLLDRTGRRHIILLGCAISCAGIALQITALSWQRYFGGILVMMCGNGTLITLSPTFVGELSHPTMRGFTLCFYNFSIVLGQSLAAFITPGIIHITGRWQYRSILTVQYFFIIILFIGYWFMPESAYWLLLHDRPEEARKSLSRLHGNEALADSEFERLQGEVTKAKQLQALKGGKKDRMAFLRCLSGTNKKRTLAAVATTVGQQLCGASVVLGYVSYFFNNVHIEDVFTVTAILFAFKLIGTSSAFVFVEKYGRRGLILPGIAVLAVTLLVMGIAGCFTSTAAGWVMVVTVFIWSIVYQSTIGAAGLAFAQEVGKPSLRAQLSMIQTVCQSLMVLVFAVVIPFMLNPDQGNLGGKVGFLYFALCCIVWSTLYFMLPETKGLSFSDIDLLYARGIAPRRFKQYVREHRAEMDAEHSLDKTPTLSRRPSDVEKKDADALELEV
ncbi:MFS alpha-glucoside transporter [Stereum hirsutum FP-91666 SS1]|uniref:MFS alpha-glucoside transporter n=1 Tax=Stereum hirsutum (strain FP-91666) TaxID=721885 RepID=UPI000440A56F|nr:MFS alpha-glucoside transporter [Stereum hirsutum FP-91666 SS1]EIM92842.1 MFS alpha-glucoside transporter [Stereum hirsutum FP-91666 SS1]